jgi:hypothetical protein
MISEHDFNHDHEGADDFTKDFTASPEQDYITPFIYLKGQESIIETRKESGPQGPRGAFGAAGARRAQTGDRSAGLLAPRRPVSTLKLGTWPRAFFFGLECFTAKLPRQVHYVHCASESGPQGPRGAFLVLLARAERRRRPERWAVSAETPGQHLGTWNLAEGVFFWFGSRFYSLKKQGGRR